MESVQSVERAVAILVSLSRGGRDGRRLIDVAADTGLQKSTAHRILNTLAQDGIVEQDEVAGRFHLGFELFALGFAAVNRYGLIDLVNDSLLRLAAETEDTVFLSVRNAAEAICVDRASGAFPIKTLTLRIGDRRPLGVGSGSLALLSWLPDDEVKRVLDANASKLDSYPNFDVDTLLRLVEESRSRGYTFNDQMLVPGMRAVGVPVIGKDGRAVAALSIAAIESRVDEDRRAELARLLAEEAEKVGKRLEETTDGLTESSIRRLLPDLT
ncbi:IclR family transcriptional regulator [Actinomadura madurae]|uniref:IclR family transcriptional regulator n=1 Tax=Actinomadura madurae TaxID=1993 RepID=UPI002026C740|nr:IclR family transcriptional regulator [Actinomadura madurae]MCP9953869.1 IclR family transcriptional regulator [Actinomadura madurae]MCP9983089.1 IclR family transcriptional regulator [Actinomadura madurae]MCQ0005352.1 IclR family transcriptional regulator [Actinomadura madurae]MCQ0019336.1 IclR family transcriptional regulator [Actinomadura madurae]URN10030.1 IclR family transcriptional regulator [Actinomadura madurae]